MSNLSDFIGAAEFYSLSDFVETLNATGSVVLDPKVSNYVEQGAGNITISFENSPSSERHSALVLKRNFDFSVKFSGGTKVFGNFDALSGFSYDERILDLSFQDDVTTGITTSQDGTKAYVFGNSTNRIYEYDLSTQYDLSTATYSGNNLSTAAQISNGQGLYISNNGTRMFVVSFPNDIYQYNLSTAFDISTATYSGVTLDTIAQNVGVHDITFNTDGSKMYLCGFIENPARVYQYTLSTPFTLSTASYDGVLLDVTEVENEPRGITISPDGKRLYVSGSEKDFIYVYNLSTPFDISTATYLRNSFRLPKGEGSEGSNGLTMSSNNDKLYTIGRPISKAFEYTINAPSISTVNSFGDYTAVVVESASSELAQ